MTYTPRPGSNAHQLLAVIAKRHSIRTDELAEITSVPAIQISSVLTPAVNAGLLVCCKVDRPGQSAVNEYRMSEAGKALAFKELSGDAAARQGVATQSSSRQRGPQPAVGKNTGSASPASLSEIASAGARAVAQKPPMPAPKGRGIGPAAAMASAGDEIAITIDQDGGISVQLEPNQQIDFTPAQTLALGDFLNRTENLWRP